MTTEVSGDVNLQTLVTPFDFLTIAGITVPSVLVPFILCVFVLWFIRRKRQIRGEKYIGQASKNGLKESKRVLLKETSKKQ